MGVRPSYLRQNAWALNTMVQRKKTPDCGAARNNSIQRTSLRAAADAARYAHAVEWGWQGGQ
jgi:hypothetical protein